jgi:hypothetical protein
LGAVAFETPLGFAQRLRTVPRRPADPVEARIEQHKPAANGAIEPWELHSELVLVCPNVRKRARELLAERDPDAFLVSAREPGATPIATAEAAARAPKLPFAVVVYTLRRLAETARSAFVAVGAVIALALLAELLH